MFVENNTSFAIECTTTTFVVKQPRPTEIRDKYEIWISRDIIHETNGLAILRELAIEEL